MTRLSKAHMRIRTRIFNRALTFTSEFCLMDLMGQKGYSKVEQGVAEQLLRDLVKSGDIRKTRVKPTWYEWVN